MFEAIILTVVGGVVAAALWDGIKAIWRMTR